MEVELNVEALEGLLKPILRQVPFVVAKTINDTLFGARKNQLMMMNKHIDGGPTRWTKSGLLYSKATRSKLSGEIYFKADRPYMRDIIEGGTVTPHKGNIRLIAPVKGNIKPNRYGNLARNKIDQLDKRRNYFVGLPGGNKNQSSYGVYKITGRAKNKKLTKVIHLNKASREQKVTYEGPKFAKRYIENHLHVNLVRAAQRAVQTSR